LRDEDKYDTRQRGNKRPGTHLIPVYKDVSNGIKTTDGEGLGLGCGGENEGIDELIPGPKKGDDCRRGYSGSPHRQHNSKQSAGPGASVNDSRVDQFPRKGIKKGRAITALPFRIIFLNLEVMEIR
jgi:hypothetical protein